ncbi:MAG: VIT1/CCC1 transporter family protein [Thermoanaerobaculales bacterium]|jgi:hypothetical protein|nr:VIT1/CCC1 transporter family protein [Thermoanaerobaculales bacterium]
MPNDPARSLNDVLDPTDRTAEILFGLIMVLTFTGSLSVVQAGRGDVREMLIGALGCNLAWGIIDAAFYLMGSAAEKSRDLVTVRAVRRAPAPEVAHRLIADALPPGLASAVEPADLETMRQRLIRLPEPPDHAGLGKDDWLGGLVVFLLVFFATFPVAVPFMLMSHASAALRVSNAIAILMLFMLGYQSGRRAGRKRPWIMGIVMVVIGAAFVTLTVALGG